MADAIEEMILGGKAAAPQAPAQQPSNQQSVISENLLNSLRRVESGKDRFALNKETNAMGPYQFLPGTVQMLHKQGIEFNPFNENEARGAAKKYLEKLVQRNNGDVNKALAQYGGFVTKDPSAYVNNVMKNAAPTTAKPTQEEDPIVGMIMGSSAPAAPQEKPATAFRGSRGDSGIAGDVSPIAVKQKLFNTKDETVFGGTPVESLAAGAETALGGLYNMGVGLAGKAKGLVESVTTSPEGTYTSGKAVQYAEKVAKDFEEKYGWTPKLAKTVDYQQALAKAMQDAKIPEILPEAMALSATAGPASQQLKAAFAKKLKGSEIPSPAQTTVGGTVAQSEVPAVVRKEQQAARTVTQPSKMSPEQIASTQAIFEAKKGQLPKPTVAPEQTMPGVAPPVVAPQEQQNAPLTGVGAASVTEQKLRSERARELPIPIDLSKDQITRNPADVRFARETAKDPVLGQQFQEHYAHQNNLIQKNLDHMIESTGAEYSGLNQVELGKKLFDVVEPARAARKTQITQAYDRARQLGEMKEPVNISPLQNFVKSHEAEAINAPVIKSLEVKINSLAKDGQISLNDLEEVRKMVGRLSQDTATNATYGRQINKMIDSLTENKGGKAYQQARKLNANFMTEYENTPVMKNITALKNGNSTQRKVAMEDLIQKSVIGSTRDDTLRLFNSLTKMGPEGQKMVNELKGAVAQKIKDQATKNVQLDINGKPYVSTAALDSIITDLDKSGKLELFFGKKGAEHYRTLNQVTKEIQTVPQGTTNPSGTASTLLATMAEMGAQTAMTGVPIPVAMIAKNLYGKHQTNKKLSKVSEFVNYGKEK